MSTKKNNMWSSVLNFSFSLNYFIKSHKSFTFSFSDTLHGICSYHLSQQLIPRLLKIRVRLCSLLVTQYPTRNKEQFGSFT